MVNSDYIREFVMKWLLVFRLVCGIISFQAERNHSEFKIQIIWNIGKEQFRTKVNSLDRSTHDHAKWRNQYYARMRCITRKSFLNWVWIHAKKDYGIQSDSHEHCLQHSTHLFSRNFRNIDDKVKTIWLRHLPSCLDSLI